MNSKPKDTPEPSNRSTIAPLILFLALVAFSSWPCILALLKSNPTPEQAQMFQSGSHTLMVVATAMIVRRWPYSLLKSIKNWLTKGENENHK